MYTFIPRGVCAKEIHIDLDGTKVNNVEFVGGCNGNLKAISKLIKGMEIDDLAELLEGNTCGPRSTSCADQMIKGLREAAAAQ